ncbi:D-aspartate oxidase-like [Symsagittifera roscoffensis]|uniref:D-aspartate oxidase-like n=1 Tax=Symsagittifera roscoffensis TaxID=84072 RepID=UPI00307C120F
MPKIAVLGCGISGLSSAYRILCQFGCEVELTVISEYSYEQTTSRVAAGLWRPDEKYGSSPEMTEKLKRWFLETRIYYEEVIAKGEEWERGISSSFLLKFEPKEERSNILFDDIVPVSFRLEKDQIQALYPHAEIPTETLYANLNRNFMCRPRIYMPWMISEIKKMGGKFEIGIKVKSFEELSETYDIVINCSAMSAKELLKDDLMVPVRGQVTVVHAPWISQSLQIDFSGYILTGSDGTVTVGGCYQEGVVDWSIDYDLKDKYFEKCCEFVPSLRKAEFIEDMVGHRPLRKTGPRVEMEFWTVKSGHKKLPIIHNYGHGPEGWGLHWGTSGDVLKLFIEWMKSN